MFTLRKPSNQFIDSCIRLQRRLPYSYRESEATRDGVLPPGYRGAVHRVRLGHGPDAFTRAKEAIRGWKMFPPGFLQVCWPEAPIEVGSTVGILCRSFGLWSLHVCRIVYVVDESDGLIDRFVVEYDRRDGRVWYEVRMFCRPGNLLSRLSEPVVRRLQRKFGALTKEAMLRAVAPLEMPQSQSLCPSEA